MLESLTAYDFIATVSTDQVRMILNESLDTQNAVAFPIAVKELIRRKRLCEAIYSIVRAFDELRLKIAYDSAFAIVFTDICYEYRGIVPFFTEWYKNFRKNRRNSHEFFSKETFENIHGRRGIAFRFHCYISGTTIADIDLTTWTDIISHETDLFMRSGQYQELVEARKAALSYINDFLEDAVYELIKYPGIDVLDAHIRADLMIDEKIENLTAIPA